MTWPNVTQFWLISLTIFDIVAAFVSRAHYIVLAEGIYWWVDRLRDYLAQNPVLEVKILNYNRESGYWDIVRILTRNSQSWRVEKMRNCNWDESVGYQLILSSCGSDLIFFLNSPVDLGLGQRVTYHFLLTSFYILWIICSFIIACLQIYT